MTTRALQFDLLLTPVVDYRDKSVASAWTVYFYAAGTSNAKNVWTEKEKTNAYTSITLNGDGTKLIYGDGVYKLIFKDTAAVQVYEIDNVKCQANTFTVQSKSTTYTATSDDDVVLVDTDGGNVTINLATVAGFGHPLTIKNVGSNSVIIDPFSAQTIDGAATFTIALENQAAILYPDTTAVTWRLASVGFPNSTNVYRADWVTNSLAQDAEQAYTVTHSLGSDDVICDISAEGRSATAADKNQWAVLAYFVDGTCKAFSGDTALVTPAYEAANVPASGTIKLDFVNRDATTQITDVKITVIRVG